MKKNRFYIIATALILLISFCFGCGVQTPNDTTPEPVTLSPTSESGETDAPTHLPSEEPTLEPTPNESATGLPGTATPTPDAQPTESPSVTEPPASGDSMEIETNGLPTRFTMPTELYGVSKSECEEWFSDCVFVGDSIIVGWKQYNSLMLQSNSEFFGKTRFFCAGSYGYGHALEPVSENSIHPIYGGEQHLIEDALQMIGANKAFICFGVNDISIYGVDGTINNCRELLNRIYAKNPNIDLYIISAMYLTRDGDAKGSKLTNANLLLLNRGIAEVCNDFGIPFVNIASHLIDEEGFVPAQYSSDNFVHQTYAAYDVWADILRSVAAREIVGCPHPIFH